MSFEFASHNDQIVLDLFFDDSFKKLLHRLLSSVQYTSVHVYNCTAYCKCLQWMQNNTTKKNKPGIFLFRKNLMRKGAAAERFVYWMFNMRIF